MCRILILKILTIIEVIVLVVNGVQSPPTMTKQPQYEQFYHFKQSSDEAERPFMLECEAEGDPEPTYRWFKNGLAFNYMTYDKRINQWPNRGTLVFTKPEYVDEGVYQCFADNKYGTSVSNTVHLRAVELESFSIKRMFLLIGVREGDPFTIECIPPSGYPKPSISWIIESYSSIHPYEMIIRYINSSRITVDPEGKLHFSNVTRMDAWMYACSATSLYRSEFGLQRTALMVNPLDTSEQTSHQPIVQYVSPNNILALRGQRLELHCIFGGTPLPDIVWNKKFGSIYYSNIAYTNFGKTLIIEKVDYYEEGTYECIASNGIGSQKSHSMEVTVESKPFWIIYPNDIIISVGESVKFECFASGTPDPKLEWFVNGIPIEKAPYNNRRKIDGNVMTIEILNEIEDTAVYQCNASNIHGYVFRDFYLNVHNFPAIITEPPDNLTIAVITQSVTLRCRVFGIPNTEVMWFRDWKELTDDRYYFLKNGDLEIKNVNFTDEGKYMCLAINKFGEMYAFSDLIIKEKTKITRAPEDIEVAAHKMAVFTCIAEADPSLSLNIECLFNDNTIDLDNDSRFFKFFFNSLIINNTTENDSERHTCVAIDFNQDKRIVKLFDNSLIINNTNECDSGLYTCVAKTELDQITANATLTVLYVPNPPVIIRMDCYLSLAMIEWKPTNDCRAPILSYDIQHTTSFNPEIWVNIPVKETKYYVVLSPWTTYTFRVIARNKIGLSEPSVPSICTTEEAVPHKNPDNVMGRGTSPTNLVIKWTPMPPIEHNAPNFYYIVWWKRIDIPNSKWESKRISEWKESSLTIKNQPTFTTYNICVEAHNNRGQAPMPAIILIGYSGVGKPLHTPQRFRLKELRDSKSAIFSWESVKPESVRGHLKWYKIQTWVEGEDEKHMREVKVSPNVTEALIQVFRPFSKNYARILVFNEAFNGDPSPAINVYTPEGTAGPLALLRINSMGSNAFYLHWAPPEQPNSVLIGYRIFYEKIIFDKTDEVKYGPKLERQPQILDAFITEAKLSNLKPATKYRITMHATTNIGMGDPLYIEYTTLSPHQTHYPDVPKFKLNYTETEENIDVIAQWLPNINAINIGNYFYVQYRANGTSQWINTPKDENQETTIVHINGLKTKQTYEIRVVAVDGEYETQSETQELITS